MYYAIEVYV